jgi:hypothetical protein
MFDWFKRPNYEVPLVQPPASPYIELPKAEEIHYSIGITSENRIALRVGYSTLTMNRTGVEHLIQQLAVFRDQLEEDKDDNGQPD